METIKTIPPEVAALIPKAQLKITKGNLREFSGCIARLQAQLEKCPIIGETDGREEHPAIFHYFYGSTDIFICEYDKKNLMFGYSILGGDLENSEWGYTDLAEITKISQFNIDYHFQEQSIEAALYTAYPKHFKKPQSLDKMEVGKNDPLPKDYHDFQYEYSKSYLGTLLKKGDNQIFIFGDEETKFFQDCNRAKQKNRSLSEVIEEYFIN